MSRVTHITHVFVENIPDDLQHGVIYISILFATAIHKCCCGCDNEVVTPFSPTDWKLTFDGKTISLHPSIGNWSFACQSHYWIHQNRILWADVWSEEQINAGRMYDQVAKDRYFETLANTHVDRATAEHETPASKKPKAGLGERLRRWVQQWWKR